MERVLRVFDRHSDAEAADRAFYASLSPQERLNMLLDLVERKLVEPAEAYTKAADKTGLAASLRSRGYETPFADGENAAGGGAPGGANGPAKGLPGRPAGR